MNNYFDLEIKNTERELMNLRCAMQKTAGVIVLHKEEITLNVAVESDGLGAPQKIVYIKINSDSQKDALYFATLDKYYDDDLGPGRTEYSLYRHRWVSVRETGDGLVVHLTVIGDEKDRQTIIDGGSVVIPVQLTVCGTDLFSLEVL